MDGFNQEPNEWSGPFSEWCRINGDADPALIIEYFESVVDKYRDSEAWEIMGLSKPGSDSRINELLGVFREDGDVTDSGMRLVYIMIETFTSMVRYLSVLNSDWIHEYDEELHDHIAVASSICMSMEDTKTELCGVNCGPTNIEPTMFYQYESDDSPLGIATVRLPIGTASGYTKIIEQTLNRALLEFGKPVTIAIVSDCFMQPDESGVVFATGEAMAQDFFNNPLSNVVEGISVMLCTNTGQHCFISSVYRYGDDGLPIFNNDGRFIEVPDLDESPDTSTEQGQIKSIIGHFLLKNS